MTLVGVVYWIRGASLLQKSAKALSLDASTAVMTGLYNGSVGVRKFTAMVNLLTMLASGWLKAANSIFSNSNKVSVSWME